MIGEVVGVVTTLAAGGLGWWGRGQRAAAKAPVPLEAPTAPPSDFQYQIVLGTNNGARARKIYERAEVAPKEAVTFWDGAECRGVRSGPVG